MAFSSEQIQEIKKQLIQQIESTFPEDKKQESIEKINLMNDSQLMEFLQQNGMIKGNDSENLNPVSESSEGQQCIFCLINSGQVPSTKIAENENAIAILELNPLSEGHTLIIPKNHENPLDEKIIKFAEEIKEKLNSSLNPKQVLPENSNLFGHNVINLVPIYGNEIPSQRKQSSPEELKSVQDKILSNSSQETKIPETQKPVEDKKEIIDANKNIIPKRIP